MMLTADDDEWSVVVDEFQPEMVFSFKKRAFLFNLSPSIISSIEHFLRCGMSRVIINCTSAIVYSWMTFISTR